MNIYASRGHKVVFVNENAGYGHDQHLAQKLLVKGQVYVVERTVVSNWYTDVYLQEYPDISFNSVLFEDCEIEHTIRLSGCDAQTTFIMELSEDEVACIKKIAQKSKEVSTYSCMPVLEISETTQRDRDELAELEEDDYEF